MVLTLFLVASGTFFLLSAVPGNALSQKINKLPAATQERVLAKYGYDKPVLERYVVTLKNYIVNRDFGESIVQAGDTVSCFSKAWITTNSNRCDTRNSFRNNSSNEA